MYTVEKGCSTMELMEYLEVAPAGMLVEAEDESKSFFKLADGSWIDDDDNKYGNIDVALELDGNFKPFELNHYQLYVGNVFSSNVWCNIEIDDEYNAKTIREIYLNYLLNGVGITKDDRSMYIYVTMDATVPVVYLMELVRLFEELDIDHTININGR